MKSYFVLFDAQKVSKTLCLQASISASRKAFRFEGGLTRRFASQIGRNFSCARRVSFRNALRKLIRPFGSSASITAFSACTHYTKKALTSASGPSFYAQLLRLRAIINFSLQSDLLTPDQLFDFLVFCGAQILLLSNQWKKTLYRS